MIKSDIDFYIERNNSSLKVLSFLNKLMFIVFICLLIGGIWGFLELCKYLDITPKNILFYILAVCCLISVFFIAAFISALMPDTYKNKILPGISLICSNRLEFTNSLPSSDDDITKHNIEFVKQHFDRDVCPDLDFNNGKSIEYTYLNDLVMKHPSADIHAICGVIQAEQKVGEDVKIQILGPTIAIHLPGRFSGKCILRSTQTDSADFFKEFQVDSTHNDLSVLTEETKRVLSDILHALQETDDDNDIYIIISFDDNDFHLLIQHASTIYLSNSMANVRKNLRNDILFIYAIDTLVEHFGKNTTLKTLKPLSPTA